MRTHEAVIRNVDQVLLVFIHWNVLPCVKVFQARVVGAEEDDL